MQSVEYKRADSWSLGFEATKFFYP